MKSNVYNLLKDFKKKYPGTIAWRLKSHASVIQKHINDDEELMFVFTGQKNEHWYEIFFTTVFAFTDKRMLLGRKRFFGQYYFSSITPDMLNDFQVKSGIIWGSVVIDTVKEVFTVSNLSKKALPVIEDALSKYLVYKKLKFMSKK